MLENVLAVTGPVLEPTEQFDELSRQAGHARLVGGRLTGLAHDQLDLRAGLGDDFLDAARVDAAILDELGQSDARDLSTHRIESAEEHRRRPVVDDQVDAGGLFEGANVASLAADDPALHLLRREL